MLQMIPMKSRGTISDFPSITQVRNEAAILNSSVLYAVKWTHISHLKIEDSDEHKTEDVEEQPIRSLLLGESSLQIVKG